MKVYKKIMNGVAFVEKLILVLSTILIVVLTVGNVLSRKILHQSWSFTEELVVAVFVLITLLAAALAARDGELVNLSLLPDRLSAKARRILLVVNTVFSVAFTVVLFKYGMDKVLTQLANGKRTFVLNWPEWIFWSFVPIGAACMTLHMIEYLIDTFVKAKEEGQEKMISAILFLSFFVFLILGIPIGICLGLSSICAILYSGTSLTIVATNMYSGISKFLLLAIPFFVLSGNIMAKAGISKRLIRFVDTCVGHKKGGIAIVCVIVACFFGAISGSGPATVAALGMVLIPAMIEQRRLLRTVFHGPDGDVEFDRHCHPAEYRIRCLRIHHRRIHCRYVHRRYRSWYSDGCGSCHRCSARGKETQHSADPEESNGKRKMGCI